MLSVQDYEERAMETLPLPAREYFRRGAEDGLALQRNKDSIRRLLIRPRYLRDVSVCTMKTAIFGDEVDIPFGVSPTAFHGMAHAEGERATVKAVAALGGVFILSSLSNFSMEEVAQAAPMCVKWMQLYVYSDRGLTESFVRRAESAGYRALVLTVDSPVAGNSLSEIRCNFALPDHLRPANFDGCSEAPAVQAALHGTSREDGFSNMLARNVSWEVVRWLKRLTFLPVVLKGILSAEDAELAVQSGADAVFVSNHGGRQLDCSPATIDVLPEVVAAVAGRCPVLVDGGFDQGSSIFKALALGASMVFVGRPALWGLSCSGQDGVTDVLTILKTELNRTMALAGCRSREEIDRRMVVHESHYFSHSYSQKNVNKCLDYTQANVEMVLWGVYADDYLSQSHKTSRANDIEDSCITYSLLVLTPSVSLAELYVQDLAYLVERPAEPIFIPKGDGTVAFDVPTEYLSKRYQVLGKSYFRQFLDLPSVKRLIRVEKVKKLPDFGEITWLAHRSPFSILLPDHQQLAKKLIQIFLEQPTLKDLMAAAVYARGNVNLYLFVYAFSVSLEYRQDTRSVVLPSATVIVPELFFPQHIFERAREEAGSVLNAQQREPLVIPLNFTGTNLQLEHQVAFFREDIGLNLHHWYWHILYPFTGAIRLVKKDRRGELFYYYHNQLVARYNFERFGVHLLRAARFLDFRDPIPEGYYSKLTMKIASRDWPGRQDNSYLRDVDRPDMNLKFDIQDLERWRDLLINGIRVGFLFEESGTKRSLNNSQGIDVLGNTFEASILSINQPLYGDLHNDGHLGFALAHDPDGRHREPLGVMGNFATAARDPVFYRWHSFVSDVFKQHKERLSPYTKEELSFPSIQVNNLLVQTDDNYQPNEFNTFYEQVDLDLTSGLDFLPGGGPLYVRVTRLQHLNFTYIIQVQNSGGTDRMGFIRIFLSPKYNEQGQVMAFNELKNFMVEMDRFNLTLRPGNNRVERRSQESTLTASQLGLGEGLPPGGPVGLPNDTFYCGCGWPQNLLVPKGRADGMAANLFAMVTDYSKDRVELLPGQPTGPQACSKAPILCGVRGGLYPDKRSMGFPFDRKVDSDSLPLRSFLTPNMAAQDVSIRFLSHDP